MPNEFHPDYIQPSLGYDWRCMRCQHEWRSRHPNEPKPRACASCRSAYWDRPPRAKKEAREGVESKKGGKGKKKARKRKKRESARVLSAAETIKLQMDIAKAMAEEPRSITQITNLSSPVATQGEAAYGLTPPPHLRREYVRPSDEPAPEELIRKPKEQSKEQDWSEQ
jgi:hypothetical protein